MLSEEKLSSLPYFFRRRHYAIKGITKWRFFNVLMKQINIYSPYDCTFNYITTEENLQCLTSCSDVFTDGTFKYASKLKKFKFCTLILKLVLL